MTDHEKKKAIEKAHEEARKYNHEMYEIAGLNPIFFKITVFHDCPKSPFGWCAYDLEEDPHLDCCIYCNDPHERK
jgi:hypothetical protein